MSRVCVIGGGVVGLACAWALAREGHDVDLLDPAPGSGASHAAAGMLAPVSEAWPGEEHVLAFGLRSLGMWPAFAHRLTADSGCDIGLARHGTLLVAHDQDDARELDRVAGRLSGRGLSGERLTGRQARRLEPALSPRTVGAVLVPDDHSVDNRALVRALLAACRRRGVRLHAAAGTPTVAEGRVTGVSTVPVTGQPGFLPADHVVVAAGHLSGTVTGQRELVRPVKGQILRLRGAPGLLHHTVRARVGGTEVYLVPRASGEVVVGATSEDVGSDIRITAEAVHELLHAALTIVPGTGELELVESLARLRPATPDNIPVIGSTATEALILASGHYRSGVLMAPATAEAVAAMVLGTPPDPLVASLSPLRFAHAPNHHPQEALS